MRKFFRVRYEQHQATDAGAWLRIPPGIKRLYIQIYDNDGGNDQLGCRIGFEWKPFYFVNQPEVGKMAAYVRNVLDSTSGVTSALVNEVNYDGSASKGIKEYFEWIVPAGFAENVFRIYIANYSQGKVTILVSGRDHN